jgi:Na+-translocating ferredoxin:NAD+ oxidoreductase RnfC subunit
MTQDEIIEMAREAGIVITGEAIYTLCKLVAQHEREACANTAGLALLGADKALSDRVLKAIRARGQA